VREVLIYTGGENLRSILALVICIVIVMLCGCVIASEPVEINMPKEVVFEDGSNNIKIVQIGKEIYCRCSACLTATCSQSMTATFAH